MSDQKSGTFRDAVSVLKPGPFRRYIIGEAISMTGTWMQLMAQGWVLTTLTTSAFMFGVLNFAGSLPMLLLAMIGGNAADKYDKRAILQTTQVVQIVLALLVAYLVYSHQIQVWHLIVVAALLGISNSFEMPAAAALVPELVEHRQIAQAIAVDRSVFHATRLVGPASAGIVVGTMGAAAAFVANAFSFLGLMIAVATLPPRPKGTAEEEEKRHGGMKDGFEYVLADRPTMAMIGIISMTTIFVFPLLSIMMPLYASKTLGLDAGGMGLLMSASAIGSLAGSIGLLSVRRDLRATAMMGGGASIVAALVGLGLAQNLYVAGAAVATMTVGLSGMIGMANTIIQERAPDQLRGRVSAISGLAFFGLMPLAGLGITFVADLMGIRQALLGSAGIFAVGATWSLLAVRRALVGDEPRDAALVVPATVAVREPLGD